MSTAMALGLASLLVMVLSATLNLALRIPSRSRMQARFEQRGRAGAVTRFVARRQQYLLATAVLRSVATLAFFLAALAYGGVTAMSLHYGNTALASAVALVLVLVFSVAVPNAWSKYCGESLVVTLLFLLEFLHIICFPVIVVLHWFDPIVRRLAGVPVRDEQSYSDELEQEILHVVTEGELHGAVDEQEKEMIESVIEMADTRVDNIMTPRTQIAALPIDSELDRVLDLVRTRGHSRIPVYENTIDTILGVLYVKDLLHRKPGDAFNLSAVMRKARFIPETKSVRELLREFQERKVHIAIVLDEYGGTAGLVTIEDILEELVGEITDEYDTAAPQDLERIDDRTFEVNARMKIPDLNYQLGLSLPEDQDYETIGGFVFSTLGKIPIVGERCEFDGVAIQVLAAEPRRVTRVRLTIATPSEPAASPS